MKRKKKLFLLSISVCILVGSSIIVHAADPYSNYGWSTGAVNVKDYTGNYNSTWVAAINSGLFAWNNSDADVNISISSNSVNTIEAGHYSDTWYGLTTLSVDASTGETHRFEMKFNSRTISNDATHFSNYVKSVVVHEFGHVFWLCDNPNTTKTSIMNQGRDRNSITTPQQFDIDNVNAKY